MAELILDLVIGNINQLKSQLEGVDIGGGGGASGGSVARDNKTRTKNSSLIAAGVGGLLGFVAGLLTNLDSIIGLIKVVSGILNALVAPFVPILLTLIKPVFSLLQVLVGFMLKFFKDPVKMIQEGFESAVRTIGEAFGLSSEETEKTITDINKAYISHGEAIDRITENIKTLDEKGFKEFSKKLATDFIQDWKNVGNLVKTQLSNLRTVLGTVWDKVKVIWNEALDLLKAFLAEKWDSLKSILSEQWDNLKTIIKEKWEKLKETLSWENLKTVFMNAFDKLTETLNGLWDSLKSKVSKSLETLSDLGSFIKSKVKKLLRLGRDNESSQRVNDAIITPSGQVIKTDPADYLFATKNPRGMMGGTSVNITINGNTTSDTVDEMIRAIRTEINRKGAF